MSSITVNDVRKSFNNKTVLNGLSFRIENEILFIAGLNGAGKTTLLRLILNLDRKYEGSIHLADEKETTTERIGCVFDSPCLYADISCMQNIKIFCTGCLKDEAYVNKIISSLKIEDLLQKRAGSCSFGQQHRVSIAIALIRKPLFLFLDEPTIGLDPISWELVRAAVLENKRSQNGCVIVTGQDYYELCGISDKILVLSAGTVKFFGKPEELLSADNSDVNPATAYKDIFSALYKE